MTICGHERGVLWSVLEYVKYYDHRLPHGLACKDLPCSACRAMNDIHNPAKLAEILEHLAKDFCVDFRAYGTKDLLGSGIVYTIGGSPPIERINMPRAREIALTWIELPKGSTASDAIRAMEAT